MSSAVICEGCNKAMYADSRSDKDAYATLNIDYCRDFSQVHLCKKCYRRLAIEYLGYTETEFDDLFGGVEE